MIGGRQSAPDQGGVRLVLVHPQAGGQAVAEEDDQRVVRASGGANTGGRGQVIAGLRRRFRGEGEQQQ